MAAGQRGGRSAGPIFGPLGPPLFAQRAVERQGAPEETEEEKALHRAELRAEAERIMAAGLQEERAGVSGAELSIAEIFSYQNGSGYGERSYKNILYLEAFLEEKVIQFEKVALPPLPPEWAARGDSFLRQFSGRSFDHKALCARAAAYFEYNRLQWTARHWDCKYVAGIADVAAGRSLFAECGYTQASKILEACPRGVSVLVAPYAAWGAAWLFYCDADGLARYAEIEAETLD